MHKTPGWMPCKCLVTQSAGVDVWKQFKIIIDLFLHPGTMHVVIPFIQADGTITVISKNIRNLIGRLCNMFPSSVSYTDFDLFIALVGSVSY